MANYAPYSPIGYLAILGSAYLTREYIPKVKVSDNISYIHNMVMVFQSIILTALTIMTYVDIAHITGMSYIDPNILNSPSRFQSQWFTTSMCMFLLSKLWESLDTVLLILKNKRPIPLHLVHHCTTYWAFYSGGYCTSFFIIGFLNSVIHIVMYTFYSGVDWIKPYAKYITSMQIVHLTCGAISNVYSYRHPIHVLTPMYSVTNFMLCMTYMLMFVVFFANRYNKNK